MRPDDRTPLFHQILAVCRGWWPVDDLKLCRVALRPLLDNADRVADDVLFLLFFAYLLRRAATTEAQQDEEAREDGDGNTCERFHDVCRIISVT